MVDKKEEGLWVMVVDDDPSILECTEQLLAEEGFEVVLCQNGEEAVNKFNEKIHAVVLDLTLPDMFGLEVFEKLKEKNPLVPIILYTGMSDRWERIKVRRTFRPHAYILKGRTQDELMDTVVGAVHSYSNYLESMRLSTALERYKKENVSLREELGKRFGFESICTQSLRMKDIFQQAQKASNSPYAILITGESGVGKELLARAVHYSSPRADKPFVVLNCAAIPNDLIESELFGHEKGSFTGAIRMKVGLFETADQGSIFLDEIGDLGPSAQAKVLRVLQAKEFQRIGGTESITVDVKLISATNKDLKEEIKNNNFREDLFYRINAISFHLPPLRERKEDILLLVEHFLQQSSQELKKHITGVSPACMNLLKEYRWPGNIRELKNVIERLATWAEDGSILSDEFLPPEILSALQDTPQKYKAAGGLYKAGRNLERDMIVEALRQVKGNKSKAAETLGISRQVLYKKLELYGIESLATQ
ncbi:MAG: sigma-54-dependent transcriptional regulator [Planctomycetota bacterium]